MSDAIHALIVEDDAHHLIVLSNTLKQLNIRFKRNTTGAQVVEQLQRMHPTPHFILLDLDLPQGDAFAIIHRLQQDSVLSQIPVVALGGDQFYPMLAPLQRAGFAGFIPKPLPRRELGALLHRVAAGERLWAGV